MSIRRGEVWLADLNPIRKLGSVQIATVAAVERSVLFTLGIP